MTFCAALGLHANVIPQAQPKSTPPPTKRAHLLARASSKPVELPADDPMIEPCTIIALCRRNPVFWVQPRACRHRALPRAGCLRTRLQNRIAPLRSPTCTAL